MKETQNRQTPFVLKKIEEQLPDNFGEPLFYALCKTFPATHQEIIKSAAIIGMLYLSHRIAKYPQTKLRTFCCNLREEYAPLPLDCRHYDEICEAITNEYPTPIILINETLMPKNFLIGKEQILEALDFISNG